MNHRNKCTLLMVTTIILMTLIMFSFFSKETSLTTSNTMTICERIDTWPGRLT